MTVLAGGVGEGGRPRSERVLADRDGLNSVGRFAVRFFAVEFAVEHEEDESLDAQILLDLVQVLLPGTAAHVQVDHRARHVNLHSEQ